jgi:hypothetical protein
MDASGHGTFILCDSLAIDIISCQVDFQVEKASTALKEQGKDIILRLPF